MRPGTRQSTDVLVLAQDSAHMVQLPVVLAQVYIHNSSSPFSRSLCRPWCDEAESAVTAPGCPCSRIDVALMNDSPNPKPLDCGPLASAPAQRQSPAGFMLSAHPVEALKALAATQQHLELGRGTRVWGHQGHELSVTIPKAALKARTKIRALSPAMVPNPSGLLSHVCMCVRIYACSHV